MCLISLTRDTILNSRLTMKTLRQYVLLFSILIFPFFNFIDNLKIKHQQTKRHCLTTYHPLLPSDIHIHPIFNRVDENNHTKDDYSSSNSSSTEGGIQNQSKSIDDCSQTMGVVIDWCCWQSRIGTIEVLQGSRYQIFRYCTMGRNRKKIIFNVIDNNIQHQYQYR